MRSFLSRDKRAALLSIAVFMMVLSSGCSPKIPAAPEQITVAVAILPMVAPVYIAHAKGFDAEEGLQLNLRQFWTGREALDSVLKGESHFCTVADTPLVFAALKGEKIAVLASISDSNTFTRILARKDRGITAPVDLKGKRVGVSLGTSGEYFLHTFLISVAVAEGDVRMVDLKPERMTAALVRGEIDAAVTWDPHFTKQQEVLGSNTVVLLDRTVYKIWMNLASGREYVTGHQQTARKLLRALLRAQSFTHEHPKEAAAIVAGYLGQRDVSLQEIDFDVQLGQAFLLDLEDQARWASAKLPVRQHTTPNFLDYLFTAPLESVAPSSIMMMRR